MSGSLRAAALTPLQVKVGDSVLPHGLAQQSAPASTAAKIFLVD